MHPDGDGDSLVLVVTFFILQWSMISICRRNGYEVREAFQHSHGFLVIRKDSCIDFRDRFDEVRVIGISPWPDVRRSIAPVAGTNDIKNVAEQNQIDGFNRPIDANGPP